MNSLYKKNSIEALHLEFYKKIYWLGSRLFLGSCKRLTLSHWDLGLFFLFQQSVTLILPIVCIDSKAESG